jgi:putative acetyltransferase
MIDNRERMQRTHRNITRFVEPHAARPKGLELRKLGWIEATYILLHNCRMKDRRIVVREMLSTDARAFLEVHHAAVRGTAVADYPIAVIEAWAPIPVTGEAADGVCANRDNEYRLIAEVDGQVVGIGALVFESSELRACYVAPGAGRRGVGSALVHEIERAARERGLSMLELDSSITAEGFYRKQGYEARERTEHILGNGQRMACVKMRKSLLGES